MNENAEPIPDTPQDAAGGESLDALALEAKRLDAQPTEAAQAQAEEQRALSVQTTASNAAELLAALVMARTMALPILPQRKADALARVWSDEVLGNVAQAGAAVLELHGVALGSLLGKYAPYVALLAAVAPPVLATRAILAQPEPKDRDGQQQPS